MRFLLLGWWHLSSHVDQGAKEEAVGDHERVEVDLEGQDGRVEVVRGRRGAQRVSVVSVVIGGSLR